MRKIIVIILCFGMLVGCDILEEKEPIKKAAETFEKDDFYRYCYETLAKEEKLVYEEIFSGLSQHKDETKISTTNDKLINKILEYVTYDHPEIYYYDTAQYYKNENESRMEFKYTASKKQVKKYDQQLKATSDAFLDSINSGLSDYDKVKLTYEFMINRCDYLEGAEFNQDIRSSLILNQTVCAGYAKGMSYLLNQMGIKCAYIVGEAKDSEERQTSSHAWNLIELNGNIYYLDATWGDDVEIGPHTCYNFFLMSETDMLANYTPTIKTLPSASYVDDYFIKTNQYITSYDEALISTIIGNAIANGSRVVELKCDPSIYETLRYQLFDNYRIFELLKAYNIYHDNIVYNERSSVNIIEIVL